MGRFYNKNGMWNYLKIIPLMNALYTTLIIACVICTDCYDSRYCCRYYGIQAIAKENAYCRTGVNQYSMLNADIVTESLYAVIHRM